MTYSSRHPLPATRIATGEWGLATQPGSLVTYALGSCVGLIAYDRFAHVGGLLHALLPEASIDPERAERQPALFVDTGIPLLIAKLEEAGCFRRNLVLKLAGGANPIADQELFRIGERNVDAARQVLEAARLPLAAEDVGGTTSRTLTLDLETGNTTISCGPRRWEL